jgi:hypothetical protein
VTLFSVQPTEADQSIFLNVVKTKLCDQAYNLIKYKTINHWAQLKVLLKDHYKEKRTMAQIQMELLTCHQGKNDVRTFANKIEKILGELDDVCISTHGEESTETIQKLNKATALKAFVDGLNDSIKLIIKACRFDDLPSAIEAACDEERNVMINNRGRENSNSNCKKCGRSNHNTSQCRYNYNNAQNQNRGNNSQNNNSRDPKSNSNSQTSNNRELFCRYCKRTGHEIQFCRKRQYNSQRNTNGTENTQNVSGNESLPGPSSSGTRIRDIRTAQ